MKKTAALFAVLLLAACETAPPATVAPDVSLADLPKIALNVAHIEIDDRYSAPMKAPNVDHLFRQPPEKIAKDMIASMFEANGSYGTLRVVIEDASVIKRDLPVESGVMGVLKNEESEEYRSRVSLRFELVSDSGSSRHATVTSDRLRTLLEDSSPADRDMAFFKISESIREDLRSGFTGVVKQTFGWH